MNAEHVLAKAFAQFRDSLTNVRHGYSNGDLDSETAFFTAIEAVREAAANVVQVLEGHSEQNPLGQVEAIEGVAAQMNRVEPVRTNEAAKPLDGRVIGRTKINIPCIKEGKIILSVNDEGGHLSVEVTFVE